MLGIGTALRRSGLLLRGAVANRETPPIRRLAEIDDPDEFVWEALPHAARSFAASIVVLPSEQARTAAVAYLYCRMLDTYEDLYPDPELRGDRLVKFARRLDAVPPLPAEPIATDLARDRRDLVHLLIVERHELVDRVFVELSEPDRANIRELVTQMATGMAQAADQMSAGDGVLISEEELLRYCRAVIGEPALFTMRLLFGRAITASEREDAMGVSEMIQLANVSRDIEKDLARGIAYHADLKPYLGSRDLDESGAVTVQEVRERLVLTALSRAPSYRRLVDAAGFGVISETRGAAVIMLLFTDRYYRSAMQAIGRDPWSGLRSVWAIYASAALAALSPTWSRYVISTTELHFLEAALALSESA